MGQRVGVRRAEGRDQLLQIGLHVRERLQGLLGGRAIGLRTLHVADRGRLIGGGGRDHLLEVGIVGREVEAGRLDVG